MYNIPNAQESPRVVNGVLRWYEGDTFEVTLEVELKDQDGDPVHILEGQSLEVEFLDRSLHVVKTFRFDEVENDIVILDFDDEVTALFPKGNYTYNIYYNGVERVTLADSNKVVVE